MSEVGQLMAETARRGVQVVRKGGQLYLKGRQADVDHLMPAFQAHLASVFRLIEQWEDAKPPLLRARH